MDFNSGEQRTHIRAPSLKRGKSDNGLNERVSFDFDRIYFFSHSTIYVLLFNLKAG